MGVQVRAAFLKKLSHTIRHFQVRSFRSVHPTQQRWHMVVGIAVCRPSIRPACRKKLQLVLSFIHRDERRHEVLPASTS